MSPHTHSACYVSVVEKKLVCPNYVYSTHCVSVVYRRINAVRWTTDMYGYIYRNIGISLGTSTWANSFLFNHWWLSAAIIFIRISFAQQVKEQKTTKIIIIITCVCSGKGAKQRKKSGKIIVNRFACDKWFVRADLTNGRWRKKNIMFATHYEHISQGLVWNAKGFIRKCIKRTSQRPCELAMSRRHTHTRTQNVCEHCESSFFVGFIISLLRKKVYFFWFEMYHSIT